MSFSKNPFETSPTESTLVHPVALIHEGCEVWCAKLEPGDSLWIPTDHVFWLQFPQRGEADICFWTSGSLRSLEKWFSHDESGSRKTDIEECVERYSGMAKSLSYNELSALHSVAGNSWCTEGCINSVNEATAIFQNKKKHKLPMFVRPSGFNCTRIFSVHLIPVMF